MNGAQAGSQPCIHGSCLQVLGLDVLERSLGGIHLAKWHVIIVCPRYSSVPVLAGFLGLGTWYTVRLTANIITEEDAEQRTARQSSKRPCSSDVPQGTGSPPGDVLESSLQAPCPGFPFCACHVGFLCSNFQALRRGAGAQN